MNSVITSSLFSLLANSQSREFRAVIGADLFWHSSPYEQLIELVQNMPEPDPLGHMERKACPGIFVDDSQDRQRPSVRSPVHRHIVAPNMILPQRSETYARPLIEP